MLPTIKELRDRYLDHVAAHIMSGTVTINGGGEAPPDEQFMRDVEECDPNPIPEQGADDFRRMLMSDIGRVALGRTPSMTLATLLHNKLIEHQCRLIADLIKLLPGAFTDTARTIATVARDSGDYATAPILADACQDPGDIPEVICEHLRHPPGVHRCHVMDYIAYPKKEVSA